MTQLIKELRLLINAIARLIQTIKKRRLTHDSRLLGLFYNNLPVMTREENENGKNLL